MVLNREMKKTKMYIVFNLNSEYNMRLTAMDKIDGIKIDSLKSSK